MVALLAGERAVSRYLFRFPGAVIARQKSARRHRRRAPLDYEGLRKRSGRLEVAGGLLAALGHHVLADLLAFDHGAQTGALDGTDVDEHVLAAVGRLDESETLLGIEELYGTCGHHGLLALYALS